MLKNTARKFSLILIAICLFILLPSCQKPVILESKSSTPTSQGENASTTITTTPSKIAPSQTAEPTPPNGKPLFDKNFYALLLGEAEQYNVFDCYGRQIASFTEPYGTANGFCGLYTERGLSFLYRLNHDEVQVTSPENDENYDNSVHSYPNGFYQIRHGDQQVVLYNALGEPVRTIPFPSTSAHESIDILVDCFGDETIIFFQSKNFDQPIYSCSIYFVALDGTVNNTCEATALPGKPKELLGRKYFLVSQFGEDSARNDIYDFAGNLVLKNVQHIDGIYKFLESYHASTSIYISDYYIQNNKIYDSTLQLVAKDQLAPDGELIYGLEYTVDGITCVADHWTRAPENLKDAQPVAVGVENGRMAVKTSQNQYSFAFQGKYFLDMNEYYICVTDIGGKSFQLISTQTGEALDSLQPAASIQVADEYIIIYNGNFNQETGEYDSAYTYIIDKEGKRHDVIGTASATYGNFILLSRGPYLGIADLDGNWVIKGLNSSKVTGE